VDSGDLLFKRPTLASGQAKQEKATAAAIAEAYRLMGYDAVGIGAHDLTAGVGFLKKIGRQARLPLLSANLMDATTRKEVFTPFITKKVGKITVGIIAITDPAALQPLPADTVILPWQQVLPDLAGRLQGECDLIILLSSLPAEENRRIAETMTAIHIIFQAGGEGANLTPRQQGNTLITQAGQQGKYLGVLQLVWRQSGKWGIDRAEQLLAARRQLDQVDWQLKRLQRKGNPKTGFGGNATLNELHQRLAASRGQLVTEMATLAKPGQGTDSTCQATFTAMETSLPEDPKVQAVFEGAKAEASRSGRQKAQRTKTGKTGAQSPYLGWHKCASCHAAPTSAWRKSRHAGSFLSLTKRKQQFNLDCLPCHVTGVTAATDPEETIALPDERRLVGCESCHGPGRRHAADPTNNHLTAKPAAAVCLVCHTPDQDDDFNYQRDRSLVH